MDSAAAVTTALENLAACLAILRLDDGQATVAEWVFRSRIAKIVRLLARLRQRMVWGAHGKDGHRLSSAKRLTSDVNLTVMAR